MKTVILILTIILTSQVFGLAIDEKLSVRVLKISDSRKTLLANRGLEDGLVVGDHAKFFLTKGVVARGVVIKASPTRSVWSMYRVINANDLAADRMMNLKISKPIKVSDDQSKMISSEDIRTQINGIALAAGARDLPIESSETDRKELAALGAATSGDDFTTVLTDRDWELWSTIHLNSLTSNTTSSNATIDEDINGNFSLIDFSLGFEIYFDHTNSFFGKFSITPFLHKARLESTTIEGISSTSDILEFGAALNWHLFESPYALNRMIWYVAGSVGIGDARDERSDYRLDTNTTYEGSLNFYSLGLGVKYYVFNGFGMRLLVDYYSRTERYTLTPPDGFESFETTKLVSGPRIHAGISYRW